MNASPWVRRFAINVPAGAEVLDLACGGGRHGRVFLEKGCRVTFADKNLSDVADLADTENAQLLACDLEDGQAWSFPAARYEAIVVTNYLYRPHLKTMVTSLKAGGLLIYETFAVGNEQFGRPKNPDFLLREGELLEAVAPDMTVLAYEHGLDDQKVVQRICAVKKDGAVPFYPLRG
ncbi:class I SAM-dependent methyltransferase [Terasakiella pusilla]|uniref:class I SAM-dependent methyltransferase n=1 Tax=Terasakiella pusilla TaxID=64973 RepID=UPI003AA8AA35